MKVGIVGIVLGKFSTANRPLDFSSNNLWSSDRGLTGSEISFVMQAKELVALGHEVHAFTCLTSNEQPAIFEGFNLHHVDTLHQVVTSDFSSVISLNEPDVFRGMAVGPVRICSQYLNDFPYCILGFEEFVDVFTSPSQKHLEHVAPQTSTPDKFVVLPLGCNPDVYTQGVKVPGRVIWASSADRGLHNLLQVWSKIKAAVPHATLRIFYNFSFGNLVDVESTGDKNTDELAQRVRYMLHMIKKLSHLGVTLVGSVSRDRIDQEMSQAEVLAFPCDTRSFTEGFSIATLEACAAKACPVISDVDALGSIYAGVVPMVQSPVSHHLDQVSQLVIRGLIDTDYRNEVNERCSAFAERHTWEAVTKQLISIIEEHV